MRSLILLLAAVALPLASCANTAPLSLPTQLPPSVVVDDQLGISVELAYQAASLAERTAVKAGFVSSNSAAALIKLDNQAYYAVCTVRTAHDVANGKSPSARQDGCPPSTKANRYVSYADAARQAVALIQSLISTTIQAQANH